MMTCSGVDTILRDDRWIIFVRPNDLRMSVYSPPPPPRWSRLRASAQFSVIKGADALTLIHTLASWNVEISLAPISPTQALIGCGGHGRGTRVYHCTAILLCCRDVRHARAGVGQ